MLHIIEELDQVVNDKYLTRNNYIIKKHKQKRTNIKKLHLLNDSRCFFIGKNYD